MVVCLACVLQQTVRAGGCGRTQRETRMQKKRTKLRWDKNEQRIYKGRLSLRAGPWCGPRSEGWRRATPTTGTPARATCHGRIAGGGYIKQELEAKKTSAPLFCHVMSPKICDKILRKMVRRCKNDFPGSLSPFYQKRLAAVARWLKMPQYGPARGLRAPPNTQAAQGRRCIGAAGMCRSQTVGPGRFWRGTVGSRMRRLSMGQSHMVVYGSSHTSSWWPSKRALNCSISSTRSALPKVARAYTLSSQASHAGPGLQEEPRTSTVFVCCRMRSSHCHLSSKVRSPGAGAEAVGQGNCGGMRRAREVWNLTAKGAGAKKSDTSIV